MEDSADGGVDLIARIGRAARAELGAKGVVFEGDTIELPGMVKLATFLDSDCNRYMFAQSLMGE